MLPPEQVKWRWVRRLTGPLAVAAITIGLLSPLLLRTYHFEQKLVVRNELGDARCRFESAEARHVVFNVRKGRSYRKTFGVPTMGYAYVRCVSDGRTLQTPGHFHLIDKGLVEVILKEDGTVDVKYVSRTSQTR